jgi:tetratricopeptide (TPR) repeat protein
LGYTLADESVRLDEALVLIKKAVKLRPEDPFILDSLGWVHYRLGNYALAVDNLRKALDIRFDPEIAAHLGEVLWTQGRVDDAREMWKRGLEFQNGANNSVLDETIRRLDQ